MIYIWKIVTILFSSILMLHGIYRFLIRKNDNLIFFPMAVCYVFYVVPLILDLIAGKPEYKATRYGFIVSRDNMLVEMSYCLIVAYLMLMFWIFQGRKYQMLRAQNPARKLRMITGLGNSILILGVGYAVSSGYLNEILAMQMRYEKSSMGVALKNLGLFMVMVCLGLLLIEKRPKYFWRKLAIYLPVMLFACMMNGKKTIIMLCGVGILLVILINRYFKNPIIYVLVIAVIGILAVAVLVFYGKHYALNGNSAQNYENFRIIYGRDCTLKYTLYNEFFETRKILDYRGQSFLFYLSTLLMIRRGVWPAKPYPFATYFTSCYLGKTQFTIVNFTMTTSIVDEFLANMGVLGILLVPFFVRMFCELAWNDAEDKNPVLGDITMVLGILLSVLLFAVQISAFIYVYILFFVLVFLRKHFPKIYWSR